MASNRRFFLVERYIPSVSTGSVGSAVERLDRSGPEARHLYSVLVIDEETCLSLFEASDPGAVGTANDRADFRLDRIVEVELFPRPPSTRREA